MNVKYLSQKGQDQWVIEEVFHGKRNGYFLDLGAHDGLHISNTFALEHYFGWLGICIEANDKLFISLKKNRQCICEHVCVDGKRGRIKFLNNGGLSGIIDSDTDNNPNKNKELKQTVKNVCIKETETLAEILFRNQAPKVIDYFSLDVEGAEARIFKTFPFHRYIFRSLTIERPNQQLHELLVNKGYSFVRKSSRYNQLDSFYIHHSMRI